MWIKSFDVTMVTNTHTKACMQTIYAHLKAQTHAHALYTHAHACTHTHTHTHTHAHTHLQTLF